VENGAEIRDEYILVHCNAVPGDFRVYQSGHAIIQPKPKKRPTRRQNNVNVFMFIWDSVSRLNFIRQMPKSYKLLSEEFGAVFMKGLNKVIKLLILEIIKYHGYFGIFLTSQAENGLL
jgi:Protein of unknown function (DUF229)